MEIFYGNGGQVTPGNYNSQKLGVRAKFRVLVRFAIEIFPKKLCPGVTYGGGNWKVRVIFLRFKPSFLIFMTANTGLSWNLLLMQFLGFC